MATTPGHVAPSLPPTHSARRRRRARHGELLRSALKAASQLLSEGWGAVSPAVARAMESDPELAREMATDADPSLRRLAVMALSMVDAPWVPSMLESLVHDAWPETRALAAESAERWWRRPGAPAVPAALARAVMDLLEDPVEEVRLSVVGPVLGLAGPEGVARLVALCPSADEAMQGEIVGALASYGHHALAVELGMRCLERRHSLYLARLLGRLGGAPARAAEGSPARVSAEQGVR